MMREKDGDDNQYRVGRYLQSASLSGRLLAARIKRSTRIDDDTQHDAHLLGAIVVDVENSRRA